MSYIYVRYILKYQRVMAEIEWKEKAPLAISDDRHVGRCIETNDRVLGLLTISPHPPPRSPVRPFSLSLSFSSLLLSRSLSGAPRRTLSLTARGFPSAF